MKRSIKNASIAGGSAVVLGAAAVAAVALAHPGAHPASSASRAWNGTPSSAISKATKARLLDAACTGPAGAAYVADAGWDGFSIINTANCAVDYTTYNVGDPATPGFPDDQGYSSTDEAIAIHGDTLYFADAGDSQVAVINAATLSSKNYNPAETDINVGLFPQALAVSPDGSQVWVADTGPQTSPSSPSGVDVIDTATNKVIAKLPLTGAPSQVAFSPDGTRAYVVSNDGLWVYSTTSRRVIGQVGGIGIPRGIAASPDGKTLYVTDTTGNSVKVISVATDRVKATIAVGELPWDDVISPSGSTLYVADTDSNQVSVISTATGKVVDTIAVTGDPADLALTADGSQLYVNQQTSAYVDVIDTSDNSVVSDLNLAGTGYDNLNYDDGFEPDGIAITSTPQAPGS
jgi:YVTN family beta-propeller protein